MTAKRDLKRRVRQRQARTGESYVTARRRVLAARGQPDKRADADAEPGEATEREETIERAATERRGQTRGAMVERMEATGGETEARRSTIELEATQPGATVELGEDRATTEHGEREAAQRHQSGEALRRAAKLWRETGQMADIIAAGEMEDAGMPVVELHEVTGEARALGFRCRITVYPRVLEACELVNLLVGLQDALVRTAGDAGTARMFAVAFGLPSRPFVQVVPEPYRRETLLKFTVRGRRGAVEIACRLWLPAPTLILRLADEIEPVLLATQDAPMHLGAEGPRVSGPQLGLREQELFERALRLSRLVHARRPRLFVVHEERRHLVASDPFVIGRGRKTSDLAIRDGMISRKHAAVIFRNGTYYVKDLGSIHGIEFKGMRIDNKRIDEGDVFRLGTHELRFTYREEG
ncbi:MAG TPA: FHA domain-containing protein [Kofleriaceae bacterium]|nr:FHA domain-containing protein [Kofleriaceae bacterium]